MTTISGAGAISSPGIGSNLDVNSIIAGLMKAEQAPLNQLLKQANSIQTTISAFGAIQSTMANFREAVSKLALPSTWNATTATSADPASVSVATSPNAAPGNYAIQVQQLAAAQSTVSTTYTSSTALVGAGTLHIDLGSWDAGMSAFTQKSDTSGVDITVTSDDTLATLAGKINAAGAGVSAAVVNDINGSRLVITSKTTGSDNAFRITALAGSSAELGSLAFDPQDGTTATTQTQPAANASVTINGLAIASATNSLENVFDGLTINLGKVTDGPVQVSVAQDSDAIKKSVQTFADAYNGLSSLLGTDLKYDSTTKTAGPLQADSTAMSLQRQLRSMIGASASASSVFSSLSQVGLQLQKDGTLKIDDTKLANAMAKPSELKKFFTNVDTGNPANNGFAIQLRTFNNSVLGSDGMLTARVSGLNDKLQRNQKDQDKLNDRLAMTQARLQAQYSALDTKMAGIGTLSTYITQQISNWNKSKG